MTREQRQQSLIQARSAAQWLREHVAGQLVEPLKGQVECLVLEFSRLDVGEQKRNEAGRQGGKLGAAHGAKGGRPKGSTKNGEKK